MKYACVLFAVFVLLVGCASSAPRKASDGYQTLAHPPKRNMARAMNNEAAELIEVGDLKTAEKLLKQTLTADITFGPAHNNLGRVYFQQNKLYLAAWEFQYAIDLMPHQPEPRNNLGLVMEAVNKLDEAVAHYQAALERAPDNPEILGNLARTRLRRGDRGREMYELLTEVIMKSHQTKWRSWAREKRAMLDHEPEPDSPARDSENEPPGPSHSQSPPPEEMP